MSDVQQDSPNKEKWLSGVQWVGKHWPRVRLGHEAMMLDKIDRQRQIVEQLAQNQMTGDTANTDLWPGHDEDDMGVSIGDTIHYHTTTPQATSGAAQKILPYVLAAALAGGGGVAGAMLSSYLASKDDGQQQPVIVQPQTGTDTDTQYELRISSGE